MEYLRGSVNLRAYGQREPLVEYKKDGLRFFRQMEASIGRQVAEFVTALDLEALAKVSASAIEVEARAIGHQEFATVKKSDIGRNDPCPCGSGKKWKKCGMLETPEHNENMSKLKV
jgi:preprotein translocase subunit SecA